MAVRRCCDTQRMRLMDVLVNTPLPPPPDANNPHYPEVLDVDAALEGIPVFVVDEAAAYFFAGQRATVTLKDFPTLAPPYDSFFVEAVRPDNLAEIAGDTGYEQPYRWGALIRLVEPGSEGALNYMARLREGQPLPRWLLRADIIVQQEAGERPFGPLSTHMIPLDEEGAAQAAFVTQLWCGPEYDRAEQESIANTFLGQLLCPLLFGLCLLNARNVPRVEVVPPMTKRQRRGLDAPLVRFTTLNVKPLRDAVQAVRDANTADHPVHTALHLCRGHWKDYRETGLFGKNKGIYYWTPQLRGNPDAGAVIKDYNITPPPT